MEIISSLAQGGREMTQNVDLLYEFDMLVYKDISEWNDDYPDGRITFKDQSGNRHWFKGRWHWYESL